MLLKPDGKASQCSVLIKILMFVWSDIWGNILFNASPIELLATPQVNGSV